MENPLSSILFPSCFISMCGFDISARFNNDPYNRIQKPQVTLIPLHFVAYCRVFDD